MNAPMQVNGAAVRALVEAYRQSHCHTHAFACCSAHAVADTVPDLLARIAELEAARPSRFSATPLQVDVFLRTVLAEDTYLSYQQAIGSEAVREAMGDAQSFRNCDDNASMKQAWRSGIDDALGYIDPDGDGGPYPSQLLCSQHHSGFGPCPGAPKCTPAQFRTEATS